MSEYPRMLYRPGTKTRVWGISVDTLIVRDAEEQKAAVAEGWMLRPDSEPGISPMDHDRDGGMGGSEHQGGTDIPALRADYEALAGKRPFNGWDEATLREKIASHKEIIRGAAS
jgi:hypothetical protein